jgi:beta-glucosidase-like glycosyl hydrolase
MTNTIPAYKDASLSIDTRVQDLLSRMTLDEKIAQMHAFWLTLKEDGQHQPRPGEVVAGSDEPDAYKRKMQNGLGQISRPLGTHSVGATEGLRALNALQRFLRDETRLGIPALSHEECLLGMMTRDATLFPSPLAYGATWNPALIEQVGEQIGVECREVGCHQGLAPVLDVSRDARWGRTEETFGEDPYLTGVMATRYVRGLQGPKRDLLATLKHYVAHSASEGGRNHAPVSMGWRELHDVFMLPFEMAVKQANPGSVMPAYHDIDGEPAHASHHLLTEILRNQWGFDGLIVADYVAISLLYKHHAIARDAAESAAIAFNAGLDIELPDNETAKVLHLALERGQITQAKIDEIVSRVLTEKFRLGLFEQSFEDRAVVLRKPEAEHVALEVARQSVTVLENTGILPLPVAYAPRIAVIGPTADDALALLGGYSFPVHLILQESAAMTSHVVTPLQALRSVYGADKVTYSQGCYILEERVFGAPVFPGDVNGDGDGGGVFATASADVIHESAVSKRVDLIADAVASAQAADVAIVFVGDLPGLFQTGTVGEGSDADSLSLPGVQQALLQAIVDSGKPTIAVMTGGRPYNLGGLEKRLAAFVVAFSGGQAGGKAIAEVLAGLQEPSGRLTISVPKNVGSVPCYYNHKFKSGGTPIAFHFGSLYPFGYGLSYTQFAYDNLQLAQDKIDIESGSVELSVEVTNVGRRAGVDVVQLYVRDRHASVVRPVLELKAFSRVELEAGAKATVRFSVPVDMLNFTDHSSKRVVEPGWFDISVGKSSEDIVLRAAIEVLGNGTRTLPKNWRMESTSEVQ